MQHLLDLAKEFLAPGFAGLRQKIRAKHDDPVPHSRRAIREARRTVEQRDEPHLEAIFFRERRVFAYARVVPRLHFSGLGSAKLHERAIEGILHRANIFIAAKFSDKSSS